ncbi:uncharacterized protein LOC119093026 [Pollicipes pollicipes]|uniref:uncharacterized protein LOC119093026 n=1 Tax=Pollicipes pollicipes TaxID=41117 RepID=UPI001884EF5D|nr:uncharacterized protein LOC119093026 [Pollicipes pollicipes]
MTRAWDGNRTVNSSATYTCGDDMTTMSNKSVQVLECTDVGWSAWLEPCAACKMDIPFPGNGTMERNVSWDLGRYPGAVINYTCPNGLVQQVYCIDRSWVPSEMPACGEIT